MRADSALLSIAVHTSSSSIHSVATKFDTSDCEKMLDSTEQHGKVARIAPAQRSTTTQMQLTLESRVHMRVAVSVGFEVHAALFRCQ